MTLPPLFARGPLFAATAVLLALLSLLQLLCLWRAPALWSPAAIEVRLAAGAALTLGREALAAPQADAAHLALRREGAGRWFIGNASAGKQLLLQRADGERRMGSTPLRAGQQFQIGAARFEVSAAGARALSFAAAGEQWQYDGALLLRNGSPLPACPDAAPGARLLALWNRWAPSTLSVARPISFGGNLYCGNRLGVANVAPGSATLAASGGDVLLAAASGESTRMPLLVDGADLSRNEEALDGVTALVAGRRGRGGPLAGAPLTLAPLRHVALFDQPRVQLPPAVAWQWRQRGFWTLPAGPAWLAAAMLAAALAGAAALSWQRGRWPFERGTPHALRWGALSTALLAIAGMAALMLQRAGTPPGAGVSVLLGGAALWCCLLLPGRATLVTAAGLLLVAVGLLVQLELGLGAMESSWLRHYQKTTALLALGLGVGAHLRLRLRGKAAAPAPQSRLEWMLASLAGAALAALLLQVAFGDETGVFDLQPVEFAKLALTALTAHCLAIGLGWHAAMPEHLRPLLRWLRLATPALLFASLLGVALVQVDDYSPLILLLVWAAAMALAWSLATGRMAVAAGLALSACAAAGSVAWLRHAGASEVAGLGFYADRFLVWLDPASHPHTGQQLLLGARAITEGAWWGADRLLGMSTLGQGAGAVLAIPAVQDDFAPSFFMNRHGLFGALALWLLQALFLTGLLLAAVRAFAASSQARDYRHAWLGRFRCFALVGGAGFVLGHFLLSWGTNLAIFPIMGQPMSFLSAGGSHLLFFICPLLALGAISEQSLEEIPSCRSMSNMK
jgi:cell division protein FtsW